MFSTTQGPSTDIADNREVKIPYAGNSSQSVVSRPAASESSGNLLLYLTSPPKPTESQPALLVTVMEVHVWEALLSTILFSP